MQDFLECVLDLESDDMAGLTLLDKELKREMLATKSPVLRLLDGKIEDITRSPEEQRLFDSRMKMCSDILTEFELHFNKEKEERMKMGEEERVARTISFARSFRDTNLPIDKIAEATGLSVGEITSL